MKDSSYITNLVCRFASDSEDSIAFSLYDGQKVTDITYPRFAEDILKAAGYFRNKSIHKQHIALISPNSYRWIVNCFGIIASGNTPVLINPALPQEMLREQCKMADVSFVCGERTAISEYTFCNGLLPFDVVTAADAISVDELYSADPGETVMMAFTSGTSGKSKAVEYTAENLKSLSIYAGDICDSADMKRVQLIVPLFHIMGIGIAITTLHYANTLCIGRDVKSLFMDMPHLNPYNITIVPAILESIVKIFRNAKSQEERMRYVGNCLQRVVVGGAAVKEESVRYLMDQGIQVYGGYGMTETTGIGIIQMQDDRHIGSLGKASGSMMCRIQDGEIQISGPAVMKGYYKDPEETARMIEDGWVHTGDMGHCDADGYFYITGRKKNVMILSNGENVNPEEIEAKLGNCDAILECMVYSNGIGICADVFSENHDASADFINNYNEGVPLYRQVYKVNYSTKPLEKTGSGKIKRKENVYV